MEKTDLRAQLAEARARAAQQEILTSDAGAVYVKPAPQHGLSTVHCGEWSGTYRPAADGRLVLTSHHRGHAPASLLFGFSDRGLIRSRLVGIDPEQVSSENEKQGVRNSWFMGIIET